MHISENIQIPPTFFLPALRRGKKQNPCHRPFRTRFFTCLPDRTRSGESSASAAETTYGFSLRPPTDGPQPGVSAIFVFVFVTIADRNRSHPADCHCLRIQQLLQPTADTPASVVKLRLPSMNAYESGKTFFTCGNEIATSCCVLLAMTSRVFPMHDSQLGSDNKNRWQRNNSCITAFRGDSAGTDERISFPIHNAQCMLSRLYRELAEAYDIPKIENDLILSDQNAPTVKRVT